MRIPARRKLWYIILSIALWTILILIAHNLYNRPYSFVTPHLFSYIKIQGHKCDYSILDPFNEEMVRVIKDLQRRDPGPKNAWWSCPWVVNMAPVSFVKSEDLLIQTHDLKLRRHPASLPSCSYTPFYRVTDDENRMGPSTELTSNVTQIREEFIQVYCNRPNFKMDYRDAFFFIREKPEVEGRLSKIGVNIEGQLSVVILGLDSVSHMHFQRQMPKSHNYLVNQLKAVSLNGYTKVGENTLPNVIPLLSGQSLADLKTLCIHSRPGRSTHLDSCPFIWKEFGSRGYYTSLGEDQNDIGAIHMNWKKAFQNQPTDYDLRTFTLQTETKVTGDHRCQGTRSSFKVLLDNIEEMMNFSHKKRRPLFQFQWSTRLSHDHIENLYFGDEELLSTLRSLQVKGYLNDTAFILVSDHGGRLDELRATQQGPMEDRMPLAYFVLPPWFEFKWPGAMKNLRINSNRLTTPFDIHETLLNFLDLGNSNSNSENGRSLFTEIPAGRTCFEAGIPVHWCLCNRKKEIKDKGDPVVRDAMIYLMDSLNKFVMSRDKERECNILKLERITKVLRWMNGNNPLRNVQGGEVWILEISFGTRPGGGTFEGTVVRAEGWRKWAMTEKIVRTNKYGGQSHCVQNLEIREYCSCRKSQ